MPSTIVALLPCPFCGRQAFQEFLDYADMYKVGCPGISPDEVDDEDSPDDKPACPLEPVINGHYLNDLVTKWNSRSSMFGTLSTKVPPPLSAHAQKPKHTMFAHCGCSISYGNIRICAGHNGRWQSMDNAPKDRNIIACGPMMGVCPIRWDTITEGWKFIDPNTEVYEQCIPLKWMPFPPYPAELL